MRVGIVSKDKENVEAITVLLMNSVDLTLFQVEWNSEKIEADKVLIDIASVDLDDEWVESLLDMGEGVIISDRSLLTMTATEQASWSQRMHQALKKAPLTSQVNIRIKANPFPVWILGASTGGPQTVTDFLGSLKNPVEAAFILVQHINTEYLSVLRDAIDVVDWLSIGIMHHGQVMETKHLYICPPGYVPSIDNAGKFSLRVLEVEGHSPSIDESLKDLSRSLGKRANAIVFTGMGKDGASGIQTIAQRGGMIWCQNTESCAVPSMPQSAINTGLVNLIDSPEGLAERLLAAF